MSKIIDLKQLKTEIKKAKKRLENKPICENFGVKEVRNLKDRIDVTDMLFTHFADCMSEIENFERWCMTKCFD